MTGGKFVINITPEAIADAVQRDSSHCMIAEAVKQAIPDAGYVSVDLQTIRFSHKKLRKRYVFLTPRRAQIELIKFDQGVEPEPFSISLQRGQVIDMDERPRDGKASKRETTKVAESTIKVTAPGKLDPEQVAAINEELSKKKRPYKKAEIKGVTPGNQGHRATKVGGQAPPTGALSSSRGRQRRFGLRSLAE